MNHKTTSSVKTEVMDFSIKCCDVSYFITVECELFPKAQVLEYLLPG